MTISRQLTIALAISAALLVSACSTTDLDHFLASGPGDWSAANSTYVPYDQRGAVNAMCTSRGNTVLAGGGC